MEILDTDDANLLLHEFQDFIEELHAILFEKNEMRRVLDQHVALCRGMDERPHQAFAILLKRPGVEIASDHQGWNVDIGGVPYWPAGRLVEGILQHAVWRA